jgi:soluble lytic murein transglycosylase-like protein
VLPPLAVLVVGCFLLFYVSGLSEPTMPVPEEPPSVEALSGALSPIFTPEVQHWGGQIAVWAASAGVDPNLAATVMQIESCGDPLARSSAGAIGLFQVMPFHFDVLDNPYDPATNAARGLAYLRKALERAGGKYLLAFAGYNGGIGVIGRSESLWASETRRYVYWGEGIYADAVSGRTESPRLQEWLAAGGASLCRQAHQRLGLQP